MCTTTGTGPECNEDNKDSVCALGCSIGNLGSCIYGGSGPIGGPCAPGATGPGIDSRCNTLRCDGPTCTSTGTGRPCGGSTGETCRIQCASNGSNQCIYTTDDTVKSGPCSPGKRVGDTDTFCNHKGCAIDPISDETNFGICGFGGHGVTDCVRREECRQKCVGKGLCGLDIQAPDDAPNCAVERQNTNCAMVCSASTPATCIWSPSPSGNPAEVGCNAISDFDVGCSFFCRPDKTCGPIKPGQPAGRACSLASAATDCQMRCSNDRQCISGGTGAPCSTSSECTGECSNIPGTMGQCVVGGGGVPCNGENAATLCRATCTAGTAENPPVCQLGENGGPACTGDVSCQSRCNASLNCFFGGSGPLCSSSNDCAGACSIHEGTMGQCIAEGGGQLCTVGNEGTVCRATCTVGTAENPATCQLGENGGPVCSGDASCLHCNGEFQCVNGPPGASERGCVNNSDCSLEHASTARPNSGVAQVVQPPAIPKQTAIDIRNAKKALAKLDAKHPTFGAKKAPVHIYFFMDMTCGMCKYLGRNALDQFMTEYVKTGKVRVTYVEFPLGMMTQSVRIAEAALCANEQNKYMEFVRFALRDDANTENPATAAAQLAGYEKALELHNKKYDACMANHKYLSVIQSGAKAGAALGVVGTPSYFINGYKEGGARKFAELKTLLDQHTVLSKSEKTSKRKASKKKSH